mgnify:FL=1
MLSYIKISLVSLLLLLSGATNALELQGSVGSLQYTPKPLSWETNNYGTVDAMDADTSSPVASLKVIHSTKSNFEFGAGVAGMSEDRSAALGGMAKADIATAESVKAQATADMAALDKTSPSYDADLAEAQSRYDVANAWQAAINAQHRKSQDGLGLSVHALKCFPRSYWMGCAGVGALSGKLGDSVFAKAVLKPADRKGVNGGAEVNIGKDWVGAGLIVTF